MVEAQILSQAISSVICGEQSSKWTIFFILTTRIFPIWISCLPMLHTYLFVFHPPQIIAEIDRRF